MEKPKTQQAFTSVWFRKMFTLPAFENEEQTRTAGILTIILWAVIAIVSGLILTWWAAGKAEELGPYAMLANSIIVGVAVSLLFLIRRGHTGIAGFIFVSFLWVNITFQAFTSDGLRGSAIPIYLTIMVLVA